VSARKGSLGTPEHVQRMAIVAAQAAEAAEETRLALERSMIAYRATGASLAEVGALGGMSKQAVQKMLRRNGVA
jgi:hypothetical protein